jgi:general secretion pathway protein B
MSFILDALKKSESDRQRQNGPALFEVKVAPPRTRLPLWALAIGVLLIVNLGIVLWLLLRHPARATDTAVAAAALPAAPPAASPPAAIATAPPPAASSASSPAPSSAPASAPAATPPAAPPAAAAAAATPPTAAALRAAADAPAPEAGTADGDSNPEDYAPAQEPAAAPQGGHVKRGTAAGVPLYQDAAAVPGMQIPPLRLDLHVFAARPEDRFVMINMHKVHEGDTLPEGVHVDSITQEGAVLSYNGSRFLLPRE